MPGLFTFKPIKASLTHETDWFGQMDPYCSYIVDNKRANGQVCKSGGKDPVWEDAQTTVQSELNQSACVVEIRDKDNLFHDDIGSFTVDLDEVRHKGFVSKWYPVFHRNKPAGTIHIEVSFKDSNQPTKKVAIPVLTVVKKAIPQNGSVESPLFGKTINVKPVEGLPQGSKPYHYTS